jgi:hypothetical protein
MRTWADPIVLLDHECLAAKALRGCDRQPAEPLLWLSCSVDTVIGELPRSLGKFALANVMGCPK